VISIGEARIIAAEHHGGQAGALHTFSSTGAFVDGLRWEVRHVVDAFEYVDMWGDLNTDTQCDKDMDRLLRLLDLSEFVEAHAPRYVVTGEGTEECEEMGEALDLAANIIEKEAALVRDDAFEANAWLRPFDDLDYYEIEQNYASECGYAECVRSDDCGDFSAAIRTGSFSYTVEDGSFGRHVRVTIVYLED
jgi:hypothetical protein